MSEQVKLSKFVDHLKQELATLSNDSERHTITDIEMDLAFTSKVNDSGELSLAIADQNDTNKVNLHRIKFRLSSVDPNLSVNDEIEPESEFEGFKQRFKASVKRHGGVPPNPKKSIFDKS